jgi:hypothetical protein
MSQGISSPVATVLTRAGASGRRSQRALCGQDLRTRIMGAPRRRRSCKRSEAALLE